MTHLVLRTAIVTGRWELCWVGFALDEGHFGVAVHRAADVRVFGRNAGIQYGNLHACAKGFIPGSFGTAQNDAPLLMRLFTR